MALCETQQPQRDVEVIEVSSLSCRQGLVIYPPDIRTSCTHALVPFAEKKSPSLKRGSRLTDATNGVLDNLSVSTTEESAMDARNAIMFWAPPARPPSFLSRRRQVISGTGV